MPPPTREQRIIMEKFNGVALRQTLFTYLAIFCLAFAFIHTMFPDVSLTGIEAEWEFRGALIIAAVLVVVSFFHWRCPSCKKFLGFKIGLRACPKCQAQFKEEGKR